MGGAGVPTSGSGWRKRLPLPIRPLWRWGIAGSIAAATAPPSYPPSPPHGTAPPPVDKATQSVEVAAHGENVADGDMLDFDAWRVALQAAVSGADADGAASVGGWTDHDAGVAFNGEPTPSADATTDDAALSGADTDDSDAWTAALLAAVTGADAREEPLVDRGPADGDDGDEWDAVLAAIIEADAAEAAVAAVAAATTEDKADTAAEAVWAAAVEATTGATSGANSRTVGDGGGVGLGVGCGGGGGDQGGDPVPTGLGDCPICLEPLRPPPKLSPSLSLPRREVTAAAAWAAVEDARSPPSTRLTALWCGHVLHAPCAEAAAAHSECCPVCRHAGLGGDIIVP